MMRRASVLSLAVGVWASSQAAAQVKLEYKFPEGRVEAARTEFKLHQVLTIGGMDHEAESDVTVNDTRKFGERAADGSLPMTSTVTSARGRISAGGSSLDFDSAAPEANKEDSPLAFLGVMFKAMVGSGYTTILDAKNRFKSVEGTEAILDRAKDDPKAVAALKSQLDPEVLKREFEQDHGNLPAVLARPGEPWTTTEVAELGAGQVLTFKVRYEYQGTVSKDGRTLDKVDVRTTEAAYKIEPDRGFPLAVAQSDLKVESSKGTMLFDREAGRLVTREVEVRIKGDVTFKSGDNELPGALDLTLTRTTAVEPPKAPK